MIRYPPAYSQESISTQNRPNSPTSPGHQSSQGKIPYITNDVITNETYKNALTKIV